MLRLLAIILMATGAPALATSLGGDTDPNERGAAIAVSEVIAELYEFDRFQQDALDSADLHGSEGIQNLAETHADAARKRDAALSQIQKQANTDLTFDCQARPQRADLLAALNASDGPDFIRSFYQVEVAEHRSVIRLLQRYLVAPDNESSVKNADRAGK